MELIFTQYVRSLQPGHEPDAEGFAVVWKTLRGALVSEMKKRSLWNISPSCLGVHGRGSWMEAGAVEELMSDCYSFTFLDRLPALQAQLKVKDNVEGLVFRNIRNFLYEARKSHDPIGFRTYSVLCQAVRELVDAGTLHVVSGGPKLQRNSVLAWAPESSVVFAGSLDDSARIWSDELLPDLITGKGRRRDEVTHKLARRIHGLAGGTSGESLTAFRLGDLVDALRSAVRVRWDRFWSQLIGDVAVETVDGETVVHVGLVAPDTGIEDREDFEKLCLYMTEAVDRHEGSARVKKDLRRLWESLRLWALDPGLEKVPSRREICRFLDISRHQSAALYTLMGRWITRFQVAGQG